MKMRNKTGPSTDPCGTPLYTGLQLEYEPSRHTRCCLSASQALIQLQTKSSTPCAYNFDSRLDVGEKLYRMPWPGLGKQHLYLLCYLCKLLLSLARFLHVA